LPRIRFEAPQFDAADLDVANGFDWLSVDNDGAGSNAQLPACLREGAAGVGWTDVELGNGNLSNAELDQIVGRIGAESGQIKGEVAFECASLPQLHLGDLATIRNFPLPDGSLRTFQGQVANLVSSYSQTGGLMQALTLRYWRAT